MKSLKTLLIIAALVMPGCIGTMTPDQRLLVQFGITVGASLGQAGGTFACSKVPVENVEDRKFCLDSVKIGVDAVKAAGTIVGSTPATSNPPATGTP